MASLPSFKAPSPTRMDANRTSVCQLCASIRFQDLPSEDEPGYSHQPSLHALTISASTCALCILILDAVIKIREDIENEHQGNKGRAGWIEFSPAVSPTGRRAIEMTSLGVYSSIYATGSNEENTAPTRPSYQFASDQSVRPWLFGNWWEVDGPGGSLQLIGIGVRVGPTPNIEDAEGNRMAVTLENGDVRDFIEYRGSYLRIRTDDGTHNLSQNTHQSHRSWAELQNHR